MVTALNLAVSLRNRLSSKAQVAGLVNSEAMKKRLREQLRRCAATQTT